MRILLAKAAYVEDYIDMSIIPPLGLLYLASMVGQRRPGDEVKLIDLRYKPDTEFERLVSDWKPDVVGVSAITIEGPHASRLAARAKFLRPEVKVLVGGPHPTSYPDEVAGDPHVDAAVLHEGEETFIELLDAWERGGALDGVRGIAFKRPGGGVTRTAERPYIDDLDTLPQPAWDLVEFSDYSKFKSFGMVGPRRVAPIMTSRACPYRCTYCHDMFGKKFQSRSPENVVDEIEYLVKERGVPSFEIIDDIFNIDRPRARAILQGIIDRGLKVKLSFPNGLRGDLLDDELIELFARAGTEYVALAVETASPRLQKMIRKHMKLDRLRASIDAFVKRRVWVTCYYMLGFPTETEAEMRSTIDFACKAPSHSAMFFIVTPYQGTEMSKTLGQPLHEPHDTLSYFRSKLNVSGGIPTETLHSAAKWAYFRMLSDPRRVVRVIRDHPNPRFLLGMARLLVSRVLFDNLNNKPLLRKLRGAMDAALSGKSASLRSA